MAKGQGLPVAAKRPMSWGSVSPVEPYQGEAEAHRHWKKQSKGMTTGSLSHCIHGNSGCSEVEISPFLYRY